MNTNITKAAIDTHKKQHRVALVYPHTGEMQEFDVNNKPKDIKKMVKKVQKQAPGPVHFCYEAGVCGFALQRQIQALGARCSVIAPSLVPTKKGDKVRTDRRDAKKLLGQFIANQLTEVYPPSPTQEAARELTRCRQTANDNLMRIRHQLAKLLNRHGYIYREGSHWTQRHLQWLRTLEFDLPDLREAFDLYFTELQHCMQRLETLTKRVEALAQRPEYRPVVGALRCFRGVNTITAITIVTEIFEFGRFASAEALMAYLGLVPSEDSSGDQRHRGGITKTGNRRTRRMLVESAWHYRHRPYVSKTLRSRRQDQPQWVIDIADRAMRRLHKRYWYLVQRGKAHNKVVVALARELAGFIWATLHEYELRQKSQAA